MATADLEALASRLRAAAVASEEILGTLLLYSRTLVRSVVGEQTDLPMYQQKGTVAAEVPYLEAILVFTTIVFFLEFILDWRQYARLKIDKPPRRYGDKSKLTRVVGEIDAGNKKVEDSTDGAPPSSMLSAIVSKFSASRSYQLDKARFGFIESFFNQAEATALVLLGFMPYVWDLSVETVGRLGLAKDSEIWVALVFLAYNMLYENIVHMPFSLYSTFVVEQRHGFNKQTLALVILDKLKALLLTAVLGGPLVSCIIWVVKWGGPHFYLYVFSLMLAFQLFLLTIYPTVIAPLFNEYKPLEDGSLRKKIEGLASKVSFPLTKIFVVDGSKRSAHSNAYFYGFFKNKRIVLFDTLLKQVNDSELVAILGHELGHWKRSHTIQMFLVSQVHIFAAFYVFGYSLSNESLYASFGFSTKPTLIGLFLFFQTIWAPIDKVLSLLMNVWSRHNEYEADQFALNLGYGKELQTGLVKLQLENLSNMNPDPWYSIYHHSHPVLVERLTAIRGRRKQE